MTTTELRAPDVPTAPDSAPETAPEPLDTDVLRRFLDGRFADLREQFRREAPADLFTPSHDLSTREHRDLTRARLRTLAELGGHELGYSSRWGGGDSPGGQVAQFDMLGYGDASLMIKSGVQWGLFGGAVQALGTERHHSTLLGPLLRLELVGCFGMTETGHGSDVASIGTTATYDPAAQEFVVHTPDASCRKDYIGGAAEDADVAVVFAQLVTGGESRGVHAFVVPLRVDGVDVPGVWRGDDGRKMGLNGLDNGRLAFDHVRVPRTALLNRYADVAEDGTYSSPIASANSRFFTMLGALVKGRVSVSGGALSQTKVALEIALRYAQRRTQFKRPGGDGEVVLLDYLAHQRRLLIPLATTYALTFAQDELMGEMDELLRVQLAGGEADANRQRAFESHAAGLKVASTWHATRTIQTCREACGGNGFLADSRLPQLKADTDVFTTFEGDNTVLLQLVAKGQLTAYAQQFSDLDTLGMARFATRDFVTTYAGRSPARSLVADVVEAGRVPEDLHDRGWQLRMLAERERHVVESLAKRMRKARSRPEAERFEAVDELQDHLLLAGRAHVDRVVAEAFAAAIARCDDPAVAALLSDVFDLHALSVLEAEKGWYLQHRRMTTLRAKAITTAVNALCRKLRPRTGELLDGFGIPREWLASSLVPERG
ncbi:acyl-CoA dehydrogenase [Kineococcus radiotolerans]|uniref:acyl-CoA oxidase n=1 Tax=Kineococcus radiotolerans (strain ATCC BAA-149 / DSM 14245 / SRS30216) TaxID=266940 RepID=A6WFA4_KINRD|nr:acyl-CoA dehydrogenase [Kineococcus radiotolerans]ABS05493.1 acyl-CoA dehydrogenase domain protein [Kineococcus radiotolerans SRS30216 = ATCC BAA-149]